MPQYLITSSGDSHWHKVNSKTLRGAKQVASRTYQESVGGFIKVAEEVSHPSGENENVEVATKPGFENWINHE